LRAFLDKFGNVEGEGLDRLIDLHVMLPGGGRPDAVVMFLQSTEQTHPRLGVRPTPVLAHPLFPQIPQGLIPVIIKESGNLLKRWVFHCVDILAQLLQSELGLRFTLCMVKDSHQVPDNTAEAVHKPLIRAFQSGNRLLFLYRYIAGLLEEAPTHFPSLLGQGQACLILLGFPSRLALPAVGQQGFFEVSPDMLHRMEMVSLKSGVRIDGFDRFGKALRVIRESRGDSEAKHFSLLEKLSGILTIF
jgi:hypothetical protein